MYLVPKPSFSLSVCVLLATFRVTTVCAANDSPSLPTSDSPNSPFAPSPLLASRQSTPRPSHGGFFVPDYASTAAAAVAPSRVVYDDEDPEASRVAWLRGRAEQTRLGGAASRWKYFEARLTHPADSFALPSAPGQDDKQLRGVQPLFTFTATKHSKSGTKEDDEVKVERVKGNMGEEKGWKGTEKMPVSPPKVVSGRRGARQRFNEGGLRRSSGRARFAGNDDEVVTTPPQAQAPPFAAKDSVLGVGGNHFEEEAQGREWLRSQSPTRWALDGAAERLKRLHLRQQDALPGDGRSVPRTPGGSLSPATGSGDDSLAAEHGSSSHTETPPSFDPLQDASIHDGGASTPTTPHPPAPPVEIAPYRMWSVKTALPSINIAHAKLADQPSAYPHWQSTLAALREHEWTHQLSARVKWAADNRIDSSRPARVVTPFGAVTGGDIFTGTSPKFIDDPANPPPRLDSVVPTATQKRIHAWRELTEMLPPALTAHSNDIYEEHARGDYGEVQEEVHDAVHPVQYVSQMLRDRNGAVVLENAIHDELFQGEKDVPAEAVAHLQKVRDYRSGGKREQATAEELLGTEYATHNKFWYPYYHTKPAFNIQNPLDTPLEHFAAFAPFADAVALKKI